MKMKVTDIHVYVPDRLLAQFKKLAAKNRRSMSAEVVLAMEERLREAKQGQKTEESGVE